MSLPIVYFYSSANFEFAGQGVQEGEVLPANSTATAPGEPVEGHVYVWGNNQWTSTIDLRGFVYSTTTGERTLNTALGALGQTKTAIIPPDFFTASPTAYDFTDGAWVVNKGRVSAALAATARATRNSLLIATDWIEGTGSVVTSANLRLWSKYRQWLRDLPTQSLFPGTITWPTAPTYTNQTTVDAIATKATAIINGVADAVANPIS